MDNNLISLLGLAALGSLAGLVGGILFLVRDSWARVLSHYSVPFAAGVLLSVSLLHLMPEATESLGDTAYIIVLLSLLGSFFFEQFLCRIHHHDRGPKSLGVSAPLIIVGDTIHNFIDGVAIASAFVINPKFGLVVALASFFHETPHEIGDFGVLIRSGWGKRKTFTVNFFSALATFPGAMLVYFFLKDSTGQIGILLAISAGIFLYLGASDFLPEVEEDRKIREWEKFMLIAVGVLIMYLLTLYSPDY